MSAHMIERELFDKEFGTPGRALKIATGYLLGWGPTIGTHESGTQGWAMGAIFTDTNTKAVSVNAGNSTTADWKAITIA